MIQEYINRHFYYLAIFALVFGVIFYDTLNLTFTDEICALYALVLYFFYIYHTPNWRISKLFLAVIGIFLFYLAYSFIIHSNVPSAIVMDFIIQLKPYLGFFCIFAIAPELNKKRRLIIQLLCIVFAVYLFILGLVALTDKMFLYHFMVHPSRFATAVSIVAVLYLYVGDYSIKDKLVFLAILAIGFVSGRSKFFGFFLISLFLVFGMPHVRLKLSLKNVVVIFVVLLGVFLVAKNKIFLYFDISNFESSDGTKDLIARLALYYFGWVILKDFIPFGSGFASYATFASSEYYSPLYAKYDIDKIYGLSPDYNEFICDTYYPVLAQFGFAGVILFFAFWIWILYEAIKWQKISPDFKKFTIIVLIVSFFLIECTSDATITHNRGLFMMMLLGWIMAEMKRDAKRVTADKTNDES